MNKKEVNVRNNSDGSEGKTSQGYEVEQNTSFGEIDDCIGDLNAKAPEYHPPPPSQGHEKIEGDHNNKALHSVAALELSIGIVVKEDNLGQQNRSNIAVAMY
mgnify:CR=1 FL=1